MLYCNEYLTKDDIQKLRLYHKKSHYVPFHSTRLFVPQDKTARRYAIYSYYVLMGWVDEDEQAIYLRRDYKTFSKTTTKNVNRFIKEHNYLTIIDIELVPVD